jgi:hypothetical protein
LTTTLTGPLLREDPDDSFYPPRFPQRRLRWGAKLVTIYDHEKAAAGGYSPLDFNPIPVDPDLPTARGRFTAIKADPDQYASKYFAHIKRGHGERLSLWETLAFADVEVDPNGAMIVPLQVVEPFSYLYVRLTRTQLLARLTNQTEAASVRADIRTLQGDNFQRTRRWARWLRSRNRRIDGILYLSVRFGSGFAVVLFEGFPHSTAANHRARPRRYKELEVVKLSSRRGVRISVNALRDLPLQFDASMSIP